MSKKLIPIVAAMFVTAASAQSTTANGFSYDYVQGFYESGSLNTSVDGSQFEMDLSGAGVSASSLLTDNVFITAGFGSVNASSLKIDGTSLPLSTDATTTSFGVGFRMPIDSKTDLSLRVTSISTKVEVKASEISESQTDRDTGFGASVRYKINDGVEINATISSVDGEIGTGFGGAVNLSKSVALVGAYSTSDDATATFIGLRLMY